MHKTEGANNVANLFTDGPPGTTVEEDFMNAVQNELTNVILRAGLALKTAATETGDQLHGAQSVYGSVGRSKFEYKDADEIYINGGHYPIRGSSNLLVRITSQIAYLFTSLAASDMSYLYLDYSAIVADGVSVITASYLVDSLTEPVWSDAKKGWYNGDDPCIFAVLADGAGNIIVFDHDGGRYVGYDDEFEELAPTDIDDTFTDVNMQSSIPKFSTSAKVLFVIESNTDGADRTGYWRKNGSSGIGHRFGKADVTNLEATYDSQTVFTDASQIIEVQKGGAGLHKLSARVHGWNLPTGM